MSNSSAPPTASPEAEAVDVRYWYIGVFLNLFASLCITTGMMLQKLVHEKMKLQNDTSEYWKKPLWILGFVFIVSETVIDLVTFGFAPITILAPLSSVTLIWNVILAPFVLGEKLGLLRFLATFVILCGAVLSVAFAQHETPTYSLDEIIVLLSRPVFIFFETIMVTFLVHLHVGFAIIDAYLADGSDTASQGAESDASVTCLQQYGHVYYLGLSNLVVWLYNHVIGNFGLVVLYAFMTAALSGQAVGTAKIVIELIKATIFAEGVPFYTSWQWYLLVLYLLLLVFLLTRYLNETLRRFDALVAVPIYQSLCILLQLATAAFVFDEFRTFQLLQIICFPIGTLLCILGIYMMSVAEKRESADRVKQVSKKHEEHESHESRSCATDDEPVSSKPDMNKEKVEEVSDATQTSRAREVNDATQTTRTVEVDDATQTPSIEIRVDNGDTSEGAANNLEEKDPMPQSQASQQLNQT